MCQTNSRLMPEPNLLGIVVAGGLLTGLLGGYLARWVRIPSIVGYMVSGILVHQIAKRLGWNEPIKSTVASLNIVTDVALGLSLFMISRVFESRRLRAIWQSLGRMSLTEIAMTSMTTALGCSIAAKFVFGVNFGFSLMIGLLLGFVAVATAPAATHLVLNEYEAKGPTTDHLLGMTGLNNLASVVGFNIVLIVFAWLSLPQGPAMTGGAHWINLLLISIGSLTLGLLLGALLSKLHAWLTLAETVVIFFTTFLALSVTTYLLRKSLGLEINPLVVVIGMGAAFSNLATNPQRFEETIATIGAPILLIFFVLAGYNLHIEKLSDLGWLGLVYVITRSAGKIISIKLAMRSIGSGIGVPSNAGFGLLCQAGVAIGLGAMLMRYWPGEIANSLNTVIMASVALYELIGPMLLKTTIVRAGEVKAITLLRPTASHTLQSDQPGSILEKFRHAFIRKKLGGQILEEALTAKHIMRTNIQALSNAATFDEVLDFVEKSRLNDFPVVDSQQHYVGTIHFRSLRDLMYNPTLGNLVTAGDLVDSDIVAIRPFMPLPEVLERCQQHHLGAIGVVDENNRLIGIVEQRDLFRAMHIHQT